MAKKGRQGEGGGRPLFDGKDEKLVLAKLCEVWCLDGSDAEAAFFAEISPSSLSRYLDANPDVAARKNALKERPILLARRAIIGAFDGHMIDVVQGIGKSAKVVQIPAPVNADVALKYAERKRKIEFSTLQKVESDITGNIQTNDPAMESLKNDISGLNEAVAREMAEIEKIQKALGTKRGKK